MAKVNFKAGTLAQYTALQTKDQGTLYFLTDAKKIMRGDADVTENIVVVTNFDGTEGGVAVANAFEGKFYINITTFECRIKSGAAWVVMSPGYITDGTNFAQSGNEGKFATIAAIKAYIADQIATITGGTAFVKGVTWDMASHSLQIDKGGEAPTAVALSGMAYKPTYDAGALKLTIPVVGDDDVVINIPKDNFVRSGRYEEDYTLPDPPGGTGPAIVLVVNDGAGGGDKEVVIPAASLVETVTGGTTDTMTITVGENNAITGTVKVDPIEGNALVSSSAGLKVDVSGKADKLTAGASAHILVGSADGNLADGGVTLKTSGDMGTSATEVPVASVIAAAITAAVSAAQGTLQGAIDTLEETVSGLESDVGELQTTVSGFETALASKLSSMGAGNADEIVLSDAAGGVKRSAKKIGGAALAASPDANTVATEAAVAAAMSWQVLA